MKKIEFKIEWMSCGGCSGGVTRTLTWTNWINNADVSHETKLAKVEYDENIISENDIFTIVKNMNYTVSSI